jgi:hypothetical protein
MGGFAEISSIIINISTPQAIFSECAVENDILVGVSPDQAIEVDTEVI